MLRHHSYTRERLSQLAQRMSQKIYSATVAVENVQVSPPVDRISYDEAQKLEYRPVVRGEQFGPRWTTFWFKVQATVPEEWRGRVDLQWVSFSEVTLWLNGNSAQGLNYDPISWDGAMRPDAVLLRESKGGETVEFMSRWRATACSGNNAHLQNN
jgi:alpha-mannosidase